jgi:rhodanese-related sulfurtransferase
VRHLNAEGLAAFLRHYPHAKVLDVDFARERHDRLVADGHHVPWRMPDWGINSGFLEQVLRSLSLDDFVLVISRNGEHSSEAAALLEKSGFGHVYNLLGGYRDFAGGGGCAQREGDHDRGMAGMVPGARKI